jgi:hypothetical protein
MMIEQTVLIDVPGYDHPEPRLRALVLALICATGLFFLMLMVLAPTPDVAPSEVAVPPTAPGAPQPMVTVTAQPTSGTIPCPGDYSSQPRWPMCSIAWASDITMKLTFPDGSVSYLTAGKAPG